MKIAISSCGATLESRLDERFGRAKYFLIVDLETSAVEAIDNSTNMNAAQGAGIQAAQLIMNHGAEWLLTGHVGPNAFRTLKAAGIQIATGMTGTCHEALDQFRAGKYSPAEKEDVAGHWT